MRAIRTRLASFALALTALQIALQFAVPVSACCGPRGDVAQVRAAAEKPDCCPAGSHPPGECPLHKNQKSPRTQTSSESECRMTCDAPHGPQFLIGATGVLPAPQSIDLAFASSAIHSRVFPNLLSRAAFPDAPPPKSL